jgi:gamma-D-glutamyl-L-lysine dipeptidyl-peptidase
MSAGLCIVRAPVAPMHGEPRVSSAQISQRLAGHPLRVLEEQGDWYRVRGFDGYEGWVHRGYLYEPGSSSPNENVARDYVPRLSLGCSTRNGQGRCRDLPLGAWLDEDESVVRGTARSMDDLPKEFPRNADAIARTAVERFEGTSYQWGGVTPWGADCSGFVQSVFVLHGIQLPRDAHQQAREGLGVGDDLTVLKPADLAFFSDREDRRVTHVGIALGDLRMVHVALGRGGYNVERLDGVGDRYVRELISRFVFARRIRI